MVVNNEIVYVRRLAKCFLCNNTLLYSTETSRQFHGAKKKTIKLNSAKCIEIDKSCAIFSSLSKYIINIFNGVVYTHITRTSLSLRFDFFFFAFLFRSLFAACKNKTWRNGTANQSFVNVFSYKIEVNSSRQTVLMKPNILRANTLSHEWMRAVFLLL